MNPDIAELNTADENFASHLDALVEWDVSEDSEVSRIAAEVIREVREDGDRALLSLTARLDRFDARDMEALTLNRRDFLNAFENLPTHEREALLFAAERITHYHKQQLTTDWEYTDSDGNRLGQRITPLDRVGVYVPGGQASYPSTLLMTALPAQVAGVTDIFLTVPTPDGVRNQLLLAAAHVAGIDTAFTIGGAQAIAAMAYGTETVAKVDKIVGPGGSFVAAAKRLVSGEVGIDMIAGPSEVLVIADGSAPVEWIVLDLFSQAEHDASAQAILLCPDSAYLKAAHDAMARLLPERLRADTIGASLSARGALIKTRDLSEAVAISNRIAPEHLELAVSDPNALLADVRHAGAIFLGAHSPEVFGDYVAGPSHVLPTFGTARFSSVLGVYDFQKRSSVVRLSDKGAQALVGAAVTLANGEGLEAHARAAELRLHGIN